MICDYALMNKDNSRNSFSKHPGSIIFTLCQKTGHMSKQEKIDQFNPSGVGLKNDQFIGLPFTEEEAEVILLPLPWDLTVSYLAGTAQGPENILQASSQLDLYDPFVKDAWKMGIFMKPIPEKIYKYCQKLRPLAKSYIDFLENGGDAHQHPEMEEKRAQINQACADLKEMVRGTCLELLGKNKIIGLVGGDHSTPLGLLEALSKYHESFSILQIDAHMDLRKAYEGFTYSHASIFYNALSIESIKPLVQVGIRDYCEEEIEVVEHEADRVQVFYDHELKSRQFQGQPFHEICADILDHLSEKVYISFDIDGLQPYLCPHTGTPVPGGLAFEEAVYLLQQLVEKGHTIIGFDLCEVGPPPYEWDGNVGARLLYKMANLAGKSQGRV